LCYALAELGVHVECFVGPEETAQPDPGRGRIELTSVYPHEKLPPTADSYRVALESARARVLKHVDLVIGHGHITGEEACQIAREAYPEAKVAHIVHTNPERVGAFKAAANVDGSQVARAAAKAKLEQKNCARADVVCGVGPRLTRVAKDLLERTAESDRRIIDVNEVVELRPGADGEDLRTGPPSQERVLTLGRLDDASKGMDLFQRVISNASNEMKREVPWVLRGIRGNVADAEQAKALQASLNATVREFTTDADDLAGDLRTTTVLCMASREEGFGLVAFEAIVRSVPVLVPKDSGLGELLYALDPFDRALVEQHRDDDVLIASWTKHLTTVLEHPDRAFEDAARRRERVIAACEWRRSAEALLEACFGPGAAALRATA